MVGFYGIKIGAIVALFLGGLYVLAPTLVQEDFETRLARAAATVDGGEASGVEAAPPAWYAGYLPDTAISLGLDLQGGIDLTMQVGLEEALLGQANRDATYLLDRAEQDGFIAESIRSDRDAPVIWVQTDKSLSEVQTFLRTALPEYVYDSTDGNRHSFLMQDERQQTVQAVEQVRKRCVSVSTKRVSRNHRSSKKAAAASIFNPWHGRLRASGGSAWNYGGAGVRLHDPQFDDALRDHPRRRGGGEENYADDQKLNEWLWDTSDSTTIAWCSGSILNWKMAPLNEDPWFVNEVMLTGNDINNARVGFDKSTSHVSLDFKPRGGRVFCEVTSENVGRQFGIILDNRVRSHPNIREAICGGGASIEMGQALDALRDAQTLALVLRTGALDAPVVISQVRQVGASLGQDSIQKGSTATILGGLIVLFFMFLWYRSSGLIANIALVLNVILVLAALALFGATLTLPGIAVALTIGMAVDANIIIYERIREGLRQGPSAEGGRRRVLEGEVGRSGRQHHDGYRRDCSVLVRHRPNQRLRRDAVDWHLHNARDSALRHPDAARDPHT